MITDTHAHLFWDSFKEDLDSVIKRALEAGVNTIINVGTDLQTSKEALEQVENLSLKYSSSEVEKLHFYSSIGIHPHEAIKYFEKNNQDTRNKIQTEIGKLEEIYHKSKNPSTHSARSEPKVIAVGECGLDFNFSNRDFVPSSLPIEEIKHLQRSLLKTQVNLAKKLNLPLLIHTRDAWHEIFNFISDHFGILHCFSGDLNVLERALKTNFLISFPGTITYPKNDTLREVVKMTPLERIVFETDCPFLPPQQIRGKRNEPGNLIETIKLAAQLKNLSADEMANISTANAKKILKI